ncbi:MAG: type IX secretion system protein PorQ [Prevotellaceae bacterium]|jgi:hypothetical protein|nr:type IX secretion system protein PorQ [Prevotellaceae bacterium]
MKRIFLIITAILLYSSAFSQAGYGVYQFLNLPMDARSVSLGGTNVMINDGDINLALNNPALLSLETSNMLTFNYANYITDINYASAAYAHYAGKSKKNIIGFGVNYLDYGKFAGYTEEDNPTSTFTAKDIAVNLMYARILPKGVTVGANLRPIFSFYELYSSFGMALDIGMNYHNDTALVDVGLVVKNIGGQFTGYYVDMNGQHREPLPINLMFGISKKFKHAPFRLSFMMHNMQTWNLGYESSPIIDLEYNKQNNVNWAKMLFRHTIWALEIFPHKNLTFTASFNPRRRAEMDIPDIKTIAGFAFGAAIKISKFNVGFSLTQYQKGAFSYNVTLSTNFSDFGLD